MPHTSTDHAFIILAQIASRAATLETIALQLREHYRQCGHTVPNLEQQLTAIASIGNELVADLQRGLSVWNAQPPAYCQQD